MGATSPEEGMAGPISVFFEVLPTSIQAIIPPIPSLRRSVSQKRLRAASFLPAALFVLPPQTPLPAAETLGSEVSSTEDVSVVVEEVSDTASDGNAPVDPQGIMRYSTDSGGEGIEYDSPTPPTAETPSKGLWRFSRRGKSNSAPVAPVADPPSGIDRKFSRRGQDLLRDSEQEADPSNPECNRALERRMYVDGLAYMLQGLPRDLDDAELNIIRGSLPTPLRRDLDALQRHGGVQALQAPGAMRQPPPNTGYGQVVTRPLFSGAATPVGPSPIHRTVQAFVTGMIFLLRILASVFFMVVQSAVRVGNEYQIPEKVIGQSMVLASSVASISTSAASTIGHMGKASYAKIDDRVGNSLANILHWFIDEAISGCCDGVREGFRYPPLPQEI